MYLVKKPISAYLCGTLTEFKEGQSYAPNNAAEAHDLANLAGLGYLERAELGAPVAKAPQVEAKQPAETKATQAARPSLLKGAK